MRRISLLAALLVALSTATALAAAVHTGPLYPIATAAWTGAIGVANRRGTSGVVAVTLCSTVST